MKKAFEQQLKLKGFLKHFKVTAIEPDKV